MPTRPFTTFNFKVRLWVETNGNTSQICSAAFSDCDGLEMTLEVKTIREGGNNARQIHLMGPVSYGQLTLKRGMSEEFDLWKWFADVQQDRALRASGEIVMLSSNREREDVVFELAGCLPLKIKAPSLNAKEGLIAIEEMQIAYETLKLKSLAAASETGRGGANGGAL